MTSSQFTLNSRVLATTSKMVFTTPTSIDNARPYSDLVDRRQNTPTSTLQPTLDEQANDWQVIDAAGALRRRVPINISTRRLHHLGPLRFKSESPRRAPIVAATPTLDVLWPQEALQEAASPASLVGRESQRGRRVDQPPRLHSTPVALSLPPRSLVSTRQHSDDDEDELYEEHSYHGYNLHRRHRHHHDVARDTRSPRPRIDASPTFDERRTPLVAMATRLRALFDDNTEANTSDDIYERDWWIERVEPTADGDTVVTYAQMRKRKHQPFNNSSMPQV